MAQTQTTSNSRSHRLMRRLSLVVLLASGCRSTAVVHTHRPILTNNPTPVAAEPVEAQQAPEIAVPTTDQAIAVLRNAGGKLRPNENGEIVEVDLSFSSVTDQQVELVSTLPSVTEIDLTGTDIHDESLTALAQLASLKAIKVKGTQISSTGLLSLSGLSQLILIDASNTAVSDEALSAASGWSSLRYLSLNDTAVSDAGLRHLATLRNLKGLSLINTVVTEDGISQLKRHLPDCVIVAKSVQENTQSNDTSGLPEIPDLGPLNSSTDHVVSNQQLQQLIELAASQPHLAVHLSRVYSSREQWHETSQILATASVVDPGNDEINLALGEAYARLGRSNDAILHLERVIGANEARYVVGMIVYEDTLRSCERYFGEVAAADPNLKAAQIRHQKIQSELASLRSARRSGVQNDASSKAQETASELEIVPIQTATRTRVIE